MYILSTNINKNILKVIYLLFYNFSLIPITENIKKEKMPPKNKSDDKRSSQRVPANAVTFIGDKNTVSGSIKDISDSGARILVRHSEEKHENDLKIGIPLLHNSCINGEIRWHMENDGSIEYGIQFKDLTTEQKKALRKSILMDDALLFKSAQNLAEETDDPDMKEKIKIFFLIEVRTKIEKLIELCYANESEQGNTAVRKEYKEVITSLKEITNQLGAALNNSSLLDKIDNKVKQLLRNLILSPGEMNGMSGKPAG